MSVHSMRVKELPCIACSLDEHYPQCGVTEAHHCNEQELAGHRRVGDHAQVPLGSWHHRGVPPRGMSREDARRAFGPSLALHQKQFRERYGNDALLLAITAEQLAKL